MNGCVETKTDLDNEFYKALKAIMLTHEANVYSKNFNDYNELLAEYAKLRYALENSLPSLEFEKKLIFMLKIYNYNQIAKLMKFPKYENINLQELDTIQALNMLSWVLKFLYNSCLDLIKDFSQLARLYNEKHYEKNDEKIFDIFITNLAKTLLNLKQEKDLILENLNDKNLKSFNENNLENFDVKSLKFKI